MAAARTLIARARGLEPQRLDLVVAGVLAAAAVASVAARPAASVPRTAVALVCAALAAGMVATRRRAPVASAATVMGTIALLALADPVADETFVGLGAALVYYLLGRTGAVRGTPPLDGALVAGGVVPVALGPHLPTAIDVIATWALFVAGPFVAGRVVESRTQLTRELEANAARLAREQEARARRAAAEERTRIARELHDVIAHGVSVMVIQTAAARRVVADDPAAARTALAAVQTAGRSALLELRRMVGVLRRGDVELAGAAAPGLGQLDLLAQRARLAGLPVELHVRGPRRALPEGLDLVAFRVVQEALTNAIKHAGPARASVTVTFTPALLELEVCDDGRGEAAASVAGGSGGHGLVGMHERLTLYGGELSTGRRRGGGYRVHARLPLDGAQLA